MVYVPHGRNGGGRDSRYSSAGNAGNTGGGSSDLDANEMRRLVTEARRAYGIGACAACQPAVTPAMLCSLPALFACAC